MANETATAPGAAQADAKERGARQELVGVVTSAKMEKTIVVKVVRATQHPLYHRVVRSAKKYYAHDETREARLGDTGADCIHTATFEAEAMAAQGSCSAFNRAVACSG